MKQSSKVESVLGFLLGATMVVLGLGFIGWQVWTWLRAGVWPTYSCLDLLAALSPAQSNTYRWLVAPADWIGLHRALAWLPVSSAFLGIGILTLYFLLADRDNEPA